jgi:pantetheine-phosphate adenylyltransferase
MKKALFAGTFDPVTIGHERVIEKISNLFDEVYVSIGVNPNKTPIFSLEARLEMLNSVCKKYSNIKVVYNDGLLVDLMKREGILYNVRGVRNDSDYVYENEMHFLNEKLYPGMITLFIPCEEKFVNISSSQVRKAVKNGENLEAYLSKQVIDVITKELSK